jgi:hypothetical protein
MRESITRFVHGVREPDHSPSGPLIALDPPLVCLTHQDHPSLPVPFFLQHISPKTGHRCLTSTTGIPLHFEGSGTKQEIRSVASHVSRSSRWR